MALAITEPVANLNDATDGEGPWSFGSFTPAANSVLAVVVTVYGSNSNIGAVTDSGMGLTWTKRARVAWGPSGQNEDYLFEASVGASPAATVVSFTVTGDGGTGCLATMFQITGTGVTYVQSKTATGNNTVTQAITLDAALQTGNCYVGGGGAAGNPPATDPPTSWTETADIGHASSEGHYSAYRVGGETGTTVAWAEAANVYWGLIVAEYAEGGAAATYSGRGVGRGIGRGVMR